MYIIDTLTSKWILRERNENIILILLQFKSADIIFVSDTIEFHATWIKWQLNKKTLNGYMRI